MLTTCVEGQYQRRLNWPSRLLAVIAFYAGLTILMTWPLAIHLTDAIPGAPGDGTYGMWRTGWYPEAVLKLGVSPLIVPWLNYPEGFALMYAESTPGTALLALPLTLLGGPALGYNFVMLSSTILAGVAAYLWSFRATRSHPAALLAGMIFTFMPDHMMRLSAHVTLICTQWLALYLYLLNSTLRARSASKSAPIAAGICIGWLALSGQYLFYHALVLTPLYIAAYQRWTAGGAWKNIVAWRKLALTALIAAPFVVLGEGPYLAFSQTGNGPQTRAISEVQVHGASLTDFAVPSPNQLIARDVLGNVLDPIAGAPLGEHSTYLGIAAIALAYIALRAPRNALKRGSELKIWLFIGASALVLSLGVSLNVARQTVTVEIPAWLQNWYPFSQTFVPLPGYVLYRILPYYSAMRVWTRWAFAVSLFLSLLAGAGAAVLLHRLRSGLRLFLAVGLCLLVLADFAMIPITLTPVRGREADYWLADQPGRGAIVQLPVFQSLTYAHMVYYAEISGKPYVGSNFGSFWSPQARRLMSIQDSFPDERSIALLRELGVQWVVIDAQAFPEFDAIRPDLEFWGLKARFAEQGTWVFELIPP